MVLSPTTSFAASAGCGTTTRSATGGKDWVSHWNSHVAASAPASWATMNNGTSPGLIPANVSVNALAIVTTGLAKEVEAVNQYAADDVGAHRRTARLRGRLFGRSPRITDRQPELSRRPRWTPATGPSVRAWTPRAKTAARRTSDARTATPREGTNALRAATHADGTSPPGDTVRRSASTPA